MSKYENIDMTIEIEVDFYMSGSMLERLVNEFEDYLSAYGYRYSLNKSRYAINDYIWKKLYQLFMENLIEEYNDDVFYKIKDIAGVDLYNKFKEYKENESKGVNENE